MNENVFLLFPQESGLFEVKRKIDLPPEDVGSYVAKRVPCRCELFSRSCCVQIGGGLRCRRCRPFLRRRH